MNIDRKPSCRGWTSEDSQNGGNRESSMRDEDADQALVTYVRHFVPNAMDNDLKLRLSLVKARNYCASLRGNTIHQLAYSHACDGHEMAGEFVFADVPTERLEIAVRYCRHMVMAAFLADHLQGERANR